MTKKQTLEYVPRNVYLKLLNKVEQKDKEIVDKDKKIIALEFELNIKDKESKNDLDKNKDFWRKENRILHRKLNDLIKEIKNKK